MDKNKLIKENLEFHLNNSIKLFNNQFSFKNIVQEELKNFDKIQWLPSPGIDIENLKKSSKNELKTLLNDKLLHSKIKNVIRELKELNKKIIQENTEYQLLDNLNKIALNIPEKRNDFRLNLLFLEHNYEPEAYFCGFDDRNYKHKLLSGREYLKYDYKKELFNGAGRFDYINFLNPYLKFIEELGEEKVDRINEALSGGMYLEEIKKLFLLNGYLETHLCFDRINKKIREINIPMREEVFIFGNEHDCEQINIYVL
ncbi:hypothetical protein [Tenacibaculum dicentrarchi]|uniref:hypothetical protein n=1 Tax=Tenacibaculum dicentrarchi TaxID=669041 RepID=UPI001BE570A6